MNISKDSNHFNARLRIKRHSIVTKNRKNFIIPKTSECASHCCANKISQLRCGGGNIIKSDPAPVLTGVEGAE